MKKPLSVLVLSGVCALSLFAQDLSELSPLTNAMPVSPPVSPPVAPKDVPDSVSGEDAASPSNRIEEIPAGMPVENPDPALDEIGISSEVPAGDELVNGRISLTLKGVELREVIGLFSRLSNANIIVPDLGEEVEARQIDMNLDNVEWKPALQAILDTNDLELYERIVGTDVYSIRGKLPAADAIRSTRTFLFKHADITQAAAMITGIVGAQGQVFAYAQGNAIVVKTTQEVMEDVAQVAEKIDKPRQQVLIQSRILELTKSNDRNLGVDWGDADGGGLLNRALSISPDLQFDLGDMGINSLSTTADELTLNAGQLNVLISALDQISDVKTVSSPKVIVANGETANINILSKVPRLQRELSQTESTSGTTLTTIEVTQDDDGMDENTGRKRYAEYEFGIRLSVTPTVYSEENIAVNIVPIITRENTTLTQRTLVGSVDDESVYDTYYAIDEKRVETTFMLANQQTAVIGGLTETNTEEKESKVPLLGSIPYLGRLFSYSYTADVQTENVIFVTVSLESGQNFDIDKAVKQSPLTRRQIISDENNQIVDDHAVDLFRQQDEIRVTDDLLNADLEN